MEDTEQKTLPSKSAVELKPDSLAIMCQRGHMSRRYKQLCCDQLSLIVFELWPTFDFREFHFRSQRSIPLVDHKMEVLLVNRNTNARPNSRPEKVLKTYSSSTLLCLSIYIHKLLIVFCQQLESFCRNCRS